MKILLSRAMLLGIILMLYACSGDKVSLKEKNFTDEVAQQQNLVFTFTNHVVADSMLNTWDTLAYVEFEPAVRGRFRWTATNELTFSPEAGFEPSTDYQAHFSNSLIGFARTRKLNFKKEEAIRFHTPYLKLANTEAFWTKTQAGKIAIRMNLVFNYKVKPQEVASLLTVEVDGKKLPFELKSNLQGEVIELVLNPPASMKLDGQMAKLTLGQGLSMVGSRYKTPAPFTYEAEIPQKQKLEILQINTEYSDDKSIVRVLTSQPVEGTLTDQVKFKPAVKFTSEAHEHGFLLKGDFKAGVSYEITIAKSLKGVFGTTLGKEYSQYVVFGEPEPAIHFASRSGLYLTSRGEKNVGVQIIGVPKVNLSVYKIYENNLISHLGGGGYYYYDEEEGYYEGGDYYNPYSNYTDVGDLILQKEVSTASLPRKGNQYLLNLNFPELNDYKGIYIIKVGDTENRWLGASKSVVLSDIGLIVKETQDQILVVANSILTAEPMSGVEVKLVSSNNQTLAELTTDRNGIALFESISKKTPGFKVKMITARQGSDFTYLHFNQGKVETSRYPVEGARANPSGLQAFLYGDRDIYRPGETMYINTVLRNESWEPVSGQPVKIRVIAPNGREFAALKGKLNNQGAFANAVKLPDAAVTGTYNAEVYTANDVLLTSKAISVEEFVPDRIKVNLHLDKPVVNTNATFIAQAQALNLFGPPAANRQYEADFSLRKKNFAPASHQDYDFTIQGEEIDFENQFRQGKTNEQGELKESFQVPAHYSQMGILTGKVFITVFDETGRPVHRAENIEVLTQPVMLGIKKFDTYIDPRKPIQIPIIALTKDAKPTNAEAKVQWIRHEWHTVLEKSGSGGLRYVSQKKELLLEDRKVNISNGAGTASFVPTTSGEYEVRILLPGAGRYVSRKCYAYGWGNVQSTAFEVSKEGQILIEADQKVYTPGEHAKLLFKTPFAGKLLVTVERNKVFEHHAIETDGKSAMLSLPIREEYLPNVYIAATLIKPIDDGSMPLTVAHGYISIAAENKNSRLPLEIVASESSRSQTKQTITIKSKPESDIEVTLAVIDEGILQLKNYQSPDPYAYFFRKQALEVASYDLYPRLFPELSNRSSIAGDGYDLGRRVNPLTNKRTKLMAWWSGPLRTNSKGEATYTIDIPQFSGDLRLMAVAYKGKSFGSASRNMKVADPVIISSGLPRFLSPGDELPMLVTLTNTTDKATQATVQLNISGAVRVEGGTSKTVSLAPHAEAQVVFDISAAQKLGQAALTITASAFGEKFTEKTDITVRPATTLSKQSDAGQVQGGQIATIKVPGDYMEGTGKARVLLSRSPIVQFADNLNQLLGYPHGCAEQTTSRVFVQLYFHDLSKNLQVSTMANQSPDANVQAGISKLQSMQMYNGGLAYWPGSEYENWWASTYAAHFLLEARKAGFDVNDQVLDRLMSYLAQKCKQKHTEYYAYFDDAGTRLSKTIIPKEAAYSLYVLALAGKPEVSSMNYLRANTKQLALDSRYMLAAACQLAGDRSAAAQIIPAQFTGEKADHASGGSFYSYIRDQSVMLNALLEIDANHPQVAPLARRLSEQLKQQKYLSTQENAFALLALGKMARKANQSTVSGELMEGERKLTELTGSDVQVSQGVLGKSLRLKTSGQGTLYYFVDTEGLKADAPVREEDKGLKVRRTFLDRQGNPLQTFRQNDLVVVKLTLSTTDQSKVENVVITDLLPAGFEIENPRLGQTADLPWLKTIDYPQHFDMRDDRIHFFTDASASTKTFYYMVRVVSAGNYKIGPVSADAMYNGGYYSYNGAGNLVVGQ